jgi:hypothetical protein
MSRICIPHEEYLARVKKAAALAAEWKLDVLLVNSTESDYANARYFFRLLAAVRARRRRDQPRPATRP